MALLAVLGLVSRSPLARCVLPLCALLAALRLTLSRALLPLTRGLPGRFTLPSLLAPLSLTLGALVLRALGLSAVALSGLLVLRAGSPALAVSTTRHALG
ncbi:MAG TPA: hypothetical protein VGI23_18865 [Steroidobacteraceae bacterium]